MGDPELQSLVFRRGGGRQDAALVAQAIKEQAYTLGMDPDNEPHLLWIAKESLYARLPEVLFLDTLNLEPTG